MKRGLRLRPPDDRRLLLNAFVTNGVSHIYHGLWRHPESRQTEYKELDTWLDLALLLERGRFDSLFLADNVGLGGDHRGGWDVRIEEGLHIPINDPTALVAALAAATEHLGFVFTSSIVQEHPFSFARRVSTLDHLTPGRIGWDIVTNANANAFRNFGLPGLTAHDERYRWADEYAEVVYKLWEGSWEDDAVRVDRVRGVYADPAKVHRIDHVGERYRVEGPHLSEPSPQRTPVIHQAGSSSAGRRFAARHAEVQFIVAATPEAAADLIDDVRRRAAEAGRRPGDIRFVQGLSFVVGSTEAEARRKSEEIDGLLSLDGLLAHMSGDLGIDLASLGPDDPIDHLRTEGVRGIVEQVIANAPPGRSATVSDLADAFSRQTRVVGTPEQIADEIELWRRVGVDGINLIYAINPLSFRDFVEQVVPVLQQRGLVQREYSGGTLREKLFGGGSRLPDSHPATAYRRSRARR
mgnify:CR=1 FL=1